MSNELGWWALVNVVFGGFMAAGCAGVVGLMVYGVSWVLWYYFAMQDNDGGPVKPA